MNGRIEEVSAVKDLLRLEKETVQQRDIGTNKTKDSSFNKFIFNKNYDNNQ